MADNLNISRAGSQRVATPPPETTSQTQAQTQAAETPDPQRRTGHLGGLASRAGTALLAAGTGAVRATVSSSVVTGAGQAMRGAADALVPANQLATIGRAIGGRFAKGDGAKLRTDLQNGLTNLKAAADAGDGVAAAQDAAHQAVLQYGSHGGKTLDFLLPLVHKTALIGVSGTSMAFGVGRNTGVATGDAAVRKAETGKFHGGVDAPPSTDHVTNLKSAAAQWLLGSAIGGLGSAAGEYVKPLINTINRQHVPIAPAALVPDRMVTLMNQLEPGSGTQLRQEVAQQQADKGNINSATNKRLGQLAFDAATIARTHMQGTDALGFGGTVGVGLAVSAGAGGLIGAGMALNAALSTIEIPNLDQLQAAVDARQAAGDGAPVPPGTSLADIGKNKLPLFYPHNPTDSPLKSLRDGLLDPQPNITAADGSAAPQRSGWAVAGHTVANTLTSATNRSFEMLKATPGLFVSSFATPIVANAMPTPELQKAVRDIGAAMGIHSAIEPWFDSLAGSIPQADKAMHGRRQEAVNQDARRHMAAAIPLQTV